MPLVIAHNTHGLFIHIHVHVILLALLQALFAEPGMLAKCARGSLVSSSQTISKQH